MNPEVARRLISVDEYHKMAEVGILGPEDNVELIHGEIIEISPVGSRHASIVDKLNELLLEKIKGEAIIRVQSPIHLNESNEPEPDISILKYRADRYFDQHPGPKDILVIIEVSESSYKYDALVKGPLYASAGIPEYWIIDLEKRQIEIFGNPRDEEYLKKEIFKQSDTVTLLDKRISVDHILI